MENLFSTTRLLILSMLVCVIYYQTNIKVSPSVQAKIPLPVVKLNSLWAKVPRVSVGLKTQKIINSSEGLAPRIKQVSGPKNPASDTLYTPVGHSTQEINRSKGLAPRFKQHSGPKHPKNNNHNIIYQRSISYRN